MNRTVSHAAPAPTPASRRTRRHLALLPGLVVLAALVLAGCAEEEKKKEESTAPPAPVLEITGTYRDNWGIVQRLTASNWNDGYGNFTVLKFDNASDYLIAQNAADNTYNPNLFSRFDWTFSGEQLYYCQAAYDAASVAEAEANTSANRGDLAAGCNGFSWTTLYLRVMANRVIDYAPELPNGETLGAGFYNSALALGLPGGSTDVASLGDDGGAGGTAEGGSLTLGLGVPGDASKRVCIVDDGTAAADFVVFENPFVFSDINGVANFTEAAYVEVSENNVDFYRFAATSPDPLDANIAALVGNPANYSGVAGINTLADGGDAFDLGALVAQAGGPAAGFRACYVRLLDGGSTLADYDAHGALNTLSLSGADIDAVEALHYEAAATLAP